MRLTCSVHRSELCFLKNGHLAPGLVLVRLLRFAACGMYYQCNPGRRMLQHSPAATVIEHVPLFSGLVLDVHALFRDFGWSKLRTKARPQWSDVSSTTKHGWGRHCLPEVLGGNVLQVIKIPSSSLVPRCNTDCENGEESAVLRTVLRQRPSGAVLGSAANEHSWQAVRMNAFAPADKQSLVKRKHPVSEMSNSLRAKGRPICFDYDLVEIHDIEKSIQDGDINGLFTQSLTRFDSFQFYAATFTYLILGRLASILQNHAIATDQIEKVSNQQYLAIIFYLPSTLSIHLTMHGHRCTQYQGLKMPSVLISRSLCQIEIQNYG
uniref:Uncharacterized protein n=1 Tax=Spironucleus salmonicida TaxID=348837 RepID=V6LQ94_9EUKA|eukprot:EST46750.1 Hypothetical protein SS50377_13208 [Spironucleus salmonicida]